MAHLGYFPFLPKPESHGLQAVGGRQFTLLWPFLLQRHDDFCACEMQKRISRSFHLYTWMLGL